MDIVHFLLVLLSLFLIVLSGFIFLDRNKKKSVKKKFKEFSSRMRLRVDNMRAVPRVKIPESLEVFLKFSEEGYKKLKVKVVDLSLSGLRANLSYRVRKFPETMNFQNTIIVTPAGKIQIGSMNIVRIESTVKKGIIAFRFKNVKEEQFEILKNTISNIKNFSKNDH